MGATFFLNRIKALKLNIDNLKWRIEDLQKINPTVLALLTELHVIPSIQPYLAVSNAELIRLVVSKIDNSFYAYKSLLKTNGLFAIGSGLPIEAFNPFEIIWAANSRKKIDNIGNPFNYSEKLEKNDLIKAYTIYNAQLVDLDETLGVLEKNKPASFFISEFPINSAFNSIYNFANQTYIKSKKVYSVE
jgi:predicted amidohydrolase YtcJ